MGNTLKVKRGTNLSNAGTPAAGELIYKTDTNELFVGDGSTAATGLSAIGGSGSGDIEGVTAGVGLSGGGSSGTVSLAVDLSELTDMTASVNSSEDELIILDNGADRRKLISEIPLSAFNNDSGFITSTLTTEQVQDIVGAMFSSNTETRITATYQDSDGTIDLVVDDLDTDTQLTTENVQDIVGAMFSSNTETRISATYQDGDGTIDLVVDDMTADTNTNQLTTFQLEDGDGTEVTISHGKEVKFVEAGGININWTDTDNGTDADPYDLSFNVSTSVTAGTGLSGGGQLNADRTININFKDEDNMSSNSASHAATQQSIKAYVDAEVAGIVNSAPSALNTLDELAAALGDDANFATTTSTSLGNRLRVDTASQGLTGTQQANAITNLGITATKAELNYVDGVTSAIQTQLNAKLTSSSSLNGSNISSGTVAAARIANLAASKITSGTFDAARIAHNSFDIGDTTAETGRSVHETGIYTFNRNNGTLGTGTDSGYYSVLAFGQGVGGSAQIGAQWYSGTPNLYFRTLRDTTDDWQDWQRLLTTSDEGSGNGLDADTLDGVQGSSFLRSDATDTASGVITFSNRVTSSASGGFTIGNYSGYDRIQNSSNSFSFLTDGNGYANMTFGTVTAGTWNGSVIASAYLDSDTAHLSGTQTFSGSKTFSSDVKLTATTKLYLDGGGNSYIQEESSDNLIFRAAGGNYLRVTGSNIVLNDPGASYDVRIEGDTDSNLFFADGSADKVGIGTNSPDTKLDITASGVHGLVINQDGSNADISSRLFFKEQNSTIALYNTGDTFSFRTGATINSTSGTERMHIDTSGIDVNGSVTLDSFILDGNTISGIDDSGEFTDNDSHIMTSAAVNDRISSVIFNPDMNNVTMDQLGVNVSCNGTDGRIDAGNDIVAFSTSDKRLKENIKPLDNALDKVLKISGVSFDWKPLSEEEKKTIHGNQGHDVGVIAQEIEEVLPEVVTTRDSGYKAVKYEKIVPLLIESIKELKAEIEELKK